MLGLLLTIDIIVSVLLVVVVLSQQGKGANMGASFGSGSSQTVFGSKGAAPFMFKFTWFLVAVFFATSIGISYVAKTQTQSQAPRVDVSAGQSSQTAPANTD